MENRNPKLKELFKSIDEKFPFMSYRKEYGYLKLNDIQLKLLSEMSFKPHTHIFAAVTEWGSGIKFYELRTNRAESVNRYIEKCEQNHDHLPYRYLGVTDENGKIKCSYDS